MNLSLSLFFQLAPSHSPCLPGMTFLKKVFGDKRFKETGESNSSIQTASSNLETQRSTPSSGTPTSKLFNAPVDAVTPPPRPAFDFKDFEVTRTLGTGSFGRVCLALHKPTGQYFAMKKLRKSDVLRLKQVEHTNNERFLLAQADHPFVVKMTCTFQDERHLYIILEYVCGGELFSLLRKVRVRPTLLLRWYIYANAL